MNNIKSKIKEVFYELSPLTKILGPILGPFLIIFFFLVKEISSVEISNKWNEIVHPKKIEVSQTFSTTTIPKKFVEEVKVMSDSDKIYLGDRVTIIAKCNINPDKYRVFIQFADSDGKYYGSGSEMEFYNNQWVYYEVFNTQGKMHFRIKVENTREYKDIVYSDENEIVINRKITDTPYNYTAENVKKGTTYFDEHTGIAMSPVYFLITDVKITFTYPDGRQENEYREVGYVWSFIKDYIEYRVTLESVDYNEEVCSFKIQNDLE